MKPLCLSPLLIAILKKIFLVLFFFAPALVALSQDCNDDVIMNTIGKWKKHADAGSGSGRNRSFIMKNMETISSFFKTMYPEPKGIEPAWYQSTGNYPLVGGGPASYSFNSLYLAYYCNSNLHKMMPGGETGTWAYVFVNSLGWFISDQYDKFGITVNGNSVYELPPEKGTWKGYTLYQASAHGDKGRCIVLTHGDQLPWNLVSQQQYLVALKEKWEGIRKEQINGYSRREESLKKSIAQMQANQYMKPGDKQKIVASLQKDLDKFLQTKESDMARDNKFWYDRERKIDQYLETSAPATLQQPAIVKSAANFELNFSTVQNGGNYLVTLNPAYFNKNFPTYTPQVMVLYWRWDDNAPARYFKSRLEENFPIDKLNDMIDK